MTLTELFGLPRRELRALLEHGHAIPEGALDDTEYEGVSLGQPAWVRALTWTKFKKVFHRDPVTHDLRGWNVGVEQNALDAPWIDRTRGAARVTYWHYDVRDPRDHRPPRGHDAGLILDYARRENPVHMRAIRDPLVSLHRGSAELLLGYSYIDLGRALPTPTWFALRRGGPLVDVRPA